MVQEFIIAIGAKLAEYTVKPFLRLFRPIFCFKSILDDFRDTKRRLTEIRQEVSLDVQQARNAAQVIIPNVSKWVQDVDLLMAEVNAVMNNVQQIEDHHICFRYNWCPNWTCHCKLSKRLFQMTRAMKTLLENGNFDSVGHRAPLHQHNVGSSSSAALMHSQSSKSAFDQIMKALKNDGVNIIGIYGEAGMGKTMLAKHVAKEAKNHFERVIVIIVSKDQELRRIQGVIADYLNLTLEQESVQGRASQLKFRLEGGEKILLILHTVWKEFDFEALGIPSTDGCCKILLTAHSRSHVPDGLQTQSNVQLEILPEDEAWALFQSIAGIGDEVRAHDGAKNAIAECMGRPKALVMLGRVLKGKDPDEWDEAREQARVSKHKVTEDLEEEAKKLRLRRERIETEIKKGKNNAEEICKDVANWLIDVEKVMKEKVQFMNELNQSRYLFDKHDDETKAKELTVIMKRLYTEGNFGKVSYASPLHQLLGSAYFMPSQSAISASNQILEALQKDDVNIIGLYGMGGIGKTTLAKQVLKEVKRINIFDHAVMVTVSQNPKVMIIQSSIANFLDLKLDQETEEGRASKLNQSFKDKKILVILDDIWKPFDLTTIGITLNECKGCKILLTTRLKSVFRSMVCEANSDQNIVPQTNIQLNLLSKDEAHEFFRKKACLSEEKELKLNILIEEIVAECKGLPIALATVGAALRDKGEDEWREARDHLRNSRLVDIVGVDNDDEKNAYKCLRLSYDYLRHSEQAQGQLILLLCSLYPEDYEIEVEALSRYVFGMRLFPRVESIEDARRKVRVTIRFLKESCLLLDMVYEDVVLEDYVIMHDVVRDAMLWIGCTESQEKNVLIVRDESDLKEFTRNKSFHNCRAVSFMAESVPVLSEYNQLECPNLETILIFGGDHRVVELSNAFFQHMTSLKVFHLETLPTYKGFEPIKCRFEMPQSLYKLTDLRALMLEYCVCSNSSILGEVRNLEILSLKESEIDCGIVSGSKELRLLDLSETKAESEYPSNMIEAFPKLEELHGHLIRSSGSSSIEWELSSNLVALSVRVEDARCIPMGFSFPKLATYFISVGTWCTFLWSSASIMRCLELEGIKDESAMINICKELLPTVLELRLSNWKDLCSLAVFTSHAEGLFQRLEILEIEDCKNMERVFEFEEDENISNNINIVVQLQLLKELELSGLNELKHVWKGPTRSVSLRNLTEIKIRWCKKLTCVFPSPLLATTLEQLESLSIISCDDLEEIISRRGDSDGDDLDNIQGVKAEDEKEEPVICFQKLKILEVSRCGKLKTMFPISVAFPKLETLELEHNAELEHVLFGQSDWDCTWQYPLLEDLKLVGCPKLCTQCVATCIKNLSTTKANNITLGHILGVEDVMHIERSHLEKLSLQNLPDLECMWCGPTQSICFVNLYRLEVIGCNKLKHLSDTTMATTLPKLTELIVGRCNELEQLIVMAENGNELSAGVIFENMRIFDVSECGKLKTLVPISTGLPKLERLRIESNVELEHAFGQSDKDCTGKYPFLKELCLVGCPKICTQFVVVCIQNLSTAKAKKITLGGIQGVEDVMQIERSHLEELSLQNLPDLKCIWRGPTQNVCFVKLYRLEVIGCNGLKHLSDTTIATTLPKLTELIVGRCNELEQVIVMAENGNELIDGVVFENLTTLDVSECGKLKTISPMYIALPKVARLRIERNAELEHVFGQSGTDCNWKYPFLKELCLQGCPKMCAQFAVSCIQNLSTTKPIRKIELGDIRGVEELIQLQSHNVNQEGDNQSGDIQDADCDLLFSSLEILSLRNIAELKCVWQGPTQNICFANLNEIKVIGCNRLKHIFAIAVARSLPNLKKLIVRRCNEIEQVISVDNDGKEERENDAKAEMITNVGFESLEVLYVSNCEKLKAIFSIFIPLPKLKCLRLESNAQLESLFGQPDWVCTSSLTYLKTLSVTSCPKLCKEFITMIKSQLQPRSTSKVLRVINLSSIQGVEEVVEFHRQDDSVDKAIQLERQYLKLEELGDLKRIWGGPTPNTSFSFLGDLRVIGCSRLKQLFTTTMATSLQNLLMLSVERCHDLQQIIEEEGNEEDNTQSVQQLEFPNLDILRLIDLPKLIKFCTISCNLLLPELAEKNLIVEGCPKSITEFFSQQSYKQDNEIKLFEFDDGKDEDDDSDDYDYSSRESLRKLFGYRVVEEV